MQHRHSGQIGKGHEGRDTSADKQDGTVAIRSGPSHKSKYHDKDQNVRQRPGNCDKIAKSIAGTNFVWIFRSIKANMTRR